MRTIAARWLLPVAGPPLPGGLLTFDGPTIVAVEPAGTRLPDEVFPNAAIMPGVVNAHCHLDLSGAKGRIPPTDPEHFPDWLKGVIEYRRGLLARSASEGSQPAIAKSEPSLALQANNSGLAEVLRSGTTLLGDISSDGSSWSELANAGSTRATVYRELIGLRSESAEAAFALAEAWINAGESPLLRRGLSPHAPYSVRQTLFDRAASLGVPLAVHLAESPGERELLEHRTGPFVPFLRSLGVYDPTGFANDYGEVVERCSNALPPTFIHCNDLPPDFSFPVNASVVYCPRTHAAFGHPPHPFREFLARGVKVALGTDSLASNPDLDVFAEAQFVKRKYSDFTGELLLRMLTINGANALGWADVCGTLEPGKSADAVVIELPEGDDDPYELLLAADPHVPRKTLFQGQYR